MEHTIHSVLQEAGDHAGAFLWRRLCRDLQGELRIAVAGRDAATTQRAVASLPRDGATWVSAPIASNQALKPSTQDRLLGTHALIWMTPYATALGTDERASIAALQESGAPSRRAVVLYGAALIDRLSDDPADEREEVRQRVSELMPEGWELLEEADLPAWAAQLEPTVLAESRHRAIARVLLHDAHRHSHTDRTRSATALTEAEALLAAEDAAIADARARGRRIGAHMLAAVRHHTEDLLIDLRAFILRLEQDLPEQVAAVDDPERVRRALPHWLDHIVAGWTTDRLGAWRAAVLVDLAEVHIAEDEAPAPELLTPALHPAPVHGERDWSSRLAATAAVGGGAVLLLLGQWIPGLIAVTGGLAWSALSQASRRQQSDERLVETAIDALRRMGQDADRLLREQVERMESELEALESEQADREAARRAGQMRDLDDRRRHLVAQLDDADARFGKLVSDIEQVDPGLAKELTS